MAVKVQTGHSPKIKVRVGQSQGVKLVTTGSITSGNLASIPDIDTSNRSATNSILMYNNSTQKYEHVSAFHVVDMSDATQDSSQDAGTW